MFLRTPKDTMRILAIDPGFDRLGLAVVEGDASRPTLVWSVCFTPPKGAASERLAEVSGEITRAITEYTPGALAIETLFFGINKKIIIGSAVLVTGTIIFFIVKKYRS